MRTCDEITEWISASLDGLLTADEQTALDEHIACCPACSALLEDLRALHAAAADWEDVPAPAGFADAVMAAIAAEETQGTGKVISLSSAKKSARKTWKRWGLSAAAVAIVVLGAVSIPSLTGSVTMTKDAATEDMAYARAESEAPTEACLDQVDADSIPVPSADHSYGYLTDAEDSAVKNATSSPEAELVVSEPTSGELIYVGRLLLDGPLELLENCESAVDSDGTVTYLVSADLFAQVLALLETENPVGYTYTAGESDAQWGIILLQSN